MPDESPDHHAEAHPDRPAYIMAGSSTVVTYRELVTSSRRIAELLRSAGAGAGDCVALLIENTQGFLEVAWAAQRSGLRYTAIPTRSTASEVAYILQDSAARALFTTVKCAAVAAEAASGVARHVDVYVVDGAVAGLPSLAALLPDGPAAASPADVEGVDLLYSSGTTGHPKGVEPVLTLAPFGTAPGVAQLLKSRWSFDESTVYLSPAPLYHAAPLRFSMTVQRLGGTVIVMERFEPEPALELIHRYRVTHTQMVPTMMLRLLRLPEEQRLAHDLSSLRALIHAAAPCPPEAKRSMIEWLGPIVDEYYSSTENSLFTVISSAEAIERPGSVGRPILGTPHICDEDGNEVPVRVPGTVWSEGGFDFSYLNDPEKTARSRNRHGWTTVGDIGYVDADGYVYLCDRRTDLILSGGVNVYPQEAENLLAMHAAVRDVGVIGVPDPDLGEVAKAVVLLEAPDEAGPELAQQLLEYCRARLSPVKCPKSVDFADELPRTPTGKLYRRTLRDRYRTAPSEV